MSSAVELSIGVPSVDLQQFDMLEVWRSRDSASGPYEPLTASGSMPAQLPLDAVAPQNAPHGSPLINAVGKHLLISTHDKTFTITLTGVNPITYVMAAIQVTEQTLGAVIGTAVGALFMLKTREVGGRVRLEVTGGDLAGMIGLELNVPAFGKESHIPLVAGTTQYHFTDHQGSTEYFYKVRFRNSVLSLVSEFSDPLSPVSTPEVTDTALGFVDLTGIDGAALEGREVRLYSRFTGQLANGRVVAGYSANALTNKHGHVEFILARGLPITVAIAGTNLVRDLVVPTDTTITRFNLLDPALGTNDVFKVQVPNIPYATRRSS